MAVAEPLQTPEERSKELVAEQVGLLLAQAEHFNLECRLDDRGDYYVIYVKIAKPEGRTFILRLECDDYSRQPPLASFANPEGWINPAVKDDVQTAFWPTGGNYLADRNKGYPVMCIRGHRDYYEAAWHSGWTDPPGHHDRIYDLVVNVRNAILDIWS